MVVCGTTGEAPTLTDEEKKRCISIAIERSAGRVPVIAGTGSNNVARGIELSKFAQRFGVLEARRRVQLVDAFGENHDQSAQCSSNR